MKKKILGIFVCMLVIATAVLPVAGTVNIYNGKEMERFANSDFLPKSEYDKSVDNTNRPSLPLQLPPWFYKLFNNDWDYWSNPGVLYAIPDYVCIGPSTHAYAKLHVVGDSAGIDVLCNGTAIYADSKQGYGIWGVSSGGGGQAAGIFEAFGPHTYGLIVSSTEYDGLRTYSSGASNTALLASGSYGAYGGIFSGNVGINTSNPENALHVNGAINLDPITEPATPSAGFVLYCDSADGILKVKAAAGTITVLANP